MDKHNRRLSLLLGFGRSVCLMGAKVSQKPNLQIPPRLNAPVIHFPEAYPSRFVHVNMGLDMRQRIGRQQLQVFVRGTPGFLASISGVWITALLSGCTPKPAVRPPVLQERTPVMERPWTDDPDKFSFMILGDKTGGGEDNWPIFDRSVDEVNLLNPDFVIMVGELIQGYTPDTT
ncbi:MAG: hypothetical protein QGH20_00115 [Candidatus Latescibacteria bacterium]|nr:hypothetical protein [Candidatus Latescibacterota bacterium]